MPRAHRFVLARAHAVDVALDRERWTLTLVWHRDDPAVRELRVQLAQVAIATFGPGALPRVRMPLLENDRLVILRATSSRPGAVLGPGGDCISSFTDEGPVIADASLTAFALERNGEPRVDVRLGNVRLGAEHFTNAGDDA